MADDLLRGVEPRITMAQMAAEARRELKVRKQVYPRLVVLEKLGYGEAQRRIMIQEAIVKVLEEIA